MHKIRGQHRFSPIYLSAVGFLLVLMQLFLPWFWQFSVSSEWINVPYLCHGDTCPCSPGALAPLALGRVQAHPELWLTRDFGHVSSLALLLWEQLAGMCRLRPLISSQILPRALSCCAVFHLNCSKFQLLVFSVDWTLWNVYLQTIPLFYFHFPAECENTTSFYDLWLFFD